MGDSYRIVGLLIAAGLGGCQTTTAVSNASRGSSSSGPPTVLEVDGTTRYQRMDGFGVNAWCFPWANDQGWRWADVAYVFDEVDVHYVRLASWFSFWEAENDNADPYRLRPDGFGRAQNITATHDIPFARWLASRKLNVSLGVWNVSDWLATGSPRRVPPDRYPELAESITAYVRHMETIGVAQTVVEVQNEPDIEAGIRYDTPKDLRRAALALLSQLDRHGLSHVKLHGPNNSRPDGTAEWAKVWLADDTLRARTAAVSFHTWWDKSRAPYDAIRKIAKQYNLPVWATETGYCPLTDGCFEGQHHLRPETWATAWDFAQSYYRALAWAGASRLYHWTAVGNDAVTGPRGTRFPTLFILRHFANYIRPGDHLVKITGEGPDLKALAFEGSQGRRAVILLYEGHAPRTVQLHRAMNGKPPVQAVTSHNGTYEAAANLQVQDNVVVITLPPRSVTSLEFPP